MPFLDEVDEARGKLPGRLSRPAVAGIALVAAAVVILAALGVASTARGDFIVENGASPSPAATWGSESGSQLGESAGAGAGATAGEASAGGSAPAAGQTFSPGASGAAACYVYVVGAVREPGVYAVPEGARVRDAVQAAGGFAKKADQAAVNLARPVVDGEQITVPEEGESGQAASGAGAGEAAVASTGTPGGKVNINTADSAELQTLDGIGEATAAKIIASREAEGPFASIDDLKRVSGIGEKKFAAIADRITV